MVKFNNLFSQLDQAKIKGIFELKILMFTARDDLLTCTLADFAKLFIRVAISNVS